MASQAKVSGRPRSHAAVKVKSMNMHRTEIIRWIPVFVSNTGLSEEQSVYHMWSSCERKEAFFFFGPTFTYQGPHCVFVNRLFSLAAYFLHLNFIHTTWVQETAGWAVPHKTRPWRASGGFCAMSEWNPRRWIQGGVLAEQSCRFCSSGWKSRSAGLHWKKKGFVHTRGVSPHK